MFIQIQHTRNPPISAHHFSKKYSSLRPRLRSVLTTALARVRANRSNNRISGPSRPILPSPRKHSINDTDEVVEIDRGTALGAFAVLVGATLWHREIGIQD
jgi:hypothetical protein